MPNRTGAPPESAGPRRSAAARRGSTVAPCPKLSSSPPVALHRRAFKGRSDCLRRSRRLAIRSRGQGPALDPGEIGTSSSAAASRGERFNIARWPALSPARPRHHVNRYCSSALTRSASPPTPSRPAGRRLRRRRRRDPSLFAPAWPTAARPTPCSPTPRPAQPPCHRRAATGPPLRACPTSTSPWGRPPNVAEYEGVSREGWRVRAPRRASPSTPRSAALDRRSSPSPPRRTVVTKDDGPRPGTTVELATLQPAFKPTARSPPATPARSTTALRRGGHVRLPREALAPALARIISSASRLNPEIMGLGRSRRPPGPVPRRATSSRSTRSRQRGVRRPDHPVGQAPGIDIERTQPTRGLALGTRSHDRAPIMTTLTTATRTPAAGTASRPCASSAAQGLAMIIERL